MNIFRLTKTEYFLLAISLIFLLALWGLYEKAAVTAPGTDYTISVTQKEPETVTPEPPPLIDLNFATVEELDTLAGIGPALASRIISYREEHGPFASVDDLLKVSGIGEATLAGIRDFVTVSPTNTTLEDNPS